MLNDVYAKLKPFGYIPGNDDKHCMDCGLVFALMDPEATRCKKCARKAMNAAAGYPQGAVGLMRPAASNLSEDA